MRWLFPWLLCLSCAGAAQEDSESSPDSGLDACPRFSGAQVVGSLTSAALTETSGLAASRRHSDTWWAHNDGGHDASLFALDATGAVVAIFDLQGISQEDWEDLAVGPGPEPDVTYLYVGDIGDNLSAREQLVVHRIPEPAIEGLDPSTPNPLDGTVSLSLVYPEGQAFDAETLLVDTDGNLYVVTKSLDGQSHVFVASAPHETGQPNELTLVTTLVFGSETLPGTPYVTAGDLSADGKWWVLRTYTEAWLWPRRGAASVQDWLTGEPCPIALELEGQGEAIGISPDGSALYTVSEGDTPPLYRYSRVN
ncbi:MAG: hypothetical protein QGG40_19210 [Myxococcota bacterium]|nr:hypothetical protein [Myxococcota bacterium]